MLCQQTIVETGLGIPRLQNLEFQALEETCHCHYLFVLHSGHFNLCSSSSSRWGCSVSYWSGTMFITSKLKTDRDGRNQLFALPGSLVSCRALACEVHWWWQILGCKLVVPSLLTLSTIHFLSSRAVCVAVIILSKSSYLLILNWPLGPGLMSFVRFLQVLLKGQAVAGWGSLVGNSALIWGWPKAWSCLRVGAAWLPWKV